MRAIVLLTVCSVIKPKNNAVQSKHQFPQPTGVVNDFENILTKAAEATLELTINDPRVIGMNV